MIWAAAFLAVTTAIGLTVRVWHGYLDLMVYRLGAQTFLDGNDVYGPLPPLDGNIHLPFTYPPLAAIAFDASCAEPAGGGPTKALSVPVEPSWTNSTSAAASSMACCWAASRSAAAAASSASPSAAPPEAMRPLCTVVM